MKLSIHNMGGPALFAFRLGPHLRLTQRSGACLAFDFDADQAGLSVLIAPVDANNIYILVGEDNHPNTISYMMHPQPPQSAATYLVTTNIRAAMLDQTVVSLPAPKELLLGSARAADTGVTLVLISDVDKDESLRQYVDSHAWAPLTLQEAAAFRFEWSVIEAALMMPPAQYDFDTIHAIFRSGMSFAQKFPSITKWATETLDYGCPLWDRGGPHALLYPDLSTYEAILAEHDGEWVPKVKTDAPAAFDLDDATRQRLMNMLKGIETDPDAPVA